MLICGQLTLFELYSLFTAMHNNPKDKGIYLLMIKDASNTQGILMYTNSNLNPNV